MRSEGSDGFGDEAGIDSHGVEDTDGDGDGDVAGNEFGDEKTGNRVARGVRGGGGAAGGVEVDEEDGESVLMVGVGMDKGWVGVGVGWVGGWRVCHLPTRMVRGGGGGSMVVGCGWCGCGGGCGGGCGVWVWWLREELH